MKKIMVLLISSLCIGGGVNLFLTPFHLINGGFFGVCLLLKYLCGASVGHTMFLLNTPFYLVALKWNKAYFFNAILGLFFTSSSIELLKPLSGLILLPIVDSSILGGLIIGLGVGLMLRLHISPGGVDLLALLISKAKDVNPGVILFIIDSLIVLSGIFVLRNLDLIYSFLTISCVGLCVTLINTIKSVAYYN